MTELSGTLDGVGLPAIVRFLGGLKKTGCLRLNQQEWHGEVFFGDGQVTHASLGTRTGLSALDALVEVLPRASFGFDSQAVREGAPSITLSQDELLAHVDEVARQAASGRGLPPADAIPVQAAGEGATEEQLSLDRGTLQTLLVVDGRRSVRQIVERRGFDALWHLATLVEVGLVQLQSADAAMAASPAVVEPPAPVVEEATLIEPLPAPPPTPPVAASEPTLIGQPQTVAAADPTAAVVHCPKLGFEDDPSSSFGRPTRLHRCFAAATPLPLSLDQQRELCLSDQFATCPRLTTVAPGGSSKTAWASPAPGDEPRIVRLPLFTRPPEDHDAPSGAVNEPRPLRPLNPVVPDSEQPPRPTSMTAPTPLRARLDRAATTAAGAAAASARQPEPERIAEVPKPAPVAAPVQRGLNMSELSDVRRIGPLPVAAIPILGVVLLVVGVIVYLLLPQSDSLFGDNSYDPSNLPNTNLVASGTPVSDLDLKQPTPAPAEATPEVAGQTASGPAAQATPAAQSGFVPVTDATPAPAASNAQPTAAAPAAARAPLFDERFATNDANWPNDPRGAALISNGTYRMSTRQAGQFTAISAPIANVPADLVVTAAFKKLAGPAGGGYGLIVRDQDPGVRNGTGQDGHYYVLEAGDKGEVGIWRRDGDHWVDLLPWQHSDAVQTGTSTNELSVRAVGSSLSLSVNGTPVATRSDSAFSSGQVGLFVGGDGNQVGVTRFTVQTP